MISLFASESGAQTAERPHPIQGLNFREAIFSICTARLMLINPLDARAWNSTPYSRMPRDLFLLFLLRTLAAAALTQPRCAPHNPGIASLVIGAQVPFVGHMTLASFKRGISKRALGETGWPTRHESWERRIRIHLST